MIENLLEKSFQILQTSDRISKAINLFKEKNIKAILVFEGNKYKGIISEDRIIRVKIDLNEKLKKILVKVHPLSKSSNVKDVARSMLNNNIKVIPVYDGEWYIVSIYKLFEYLKKEKIADMKVSDIMNRNVIYLESNDHISKAISLMRKYNISRLPVVEDGKVIGIITVRDIVENIFYPLKRSKVGELSGRKEKIKDITVSSIMSKDLIYLSPEDKVMKFLDMVSKYEISGCPVLENGKLVGILTVKDILIEYLSEEGTYINISTSGIHLDELDKEWITEKIENKIIRKYRNILGDYVNVHVHIKKVKEVSEKSNILRSYNVRIKLISSKGRYFASDYGWELYNALLNCIESLENEIRKEKEKIESKEVYKELLEEIEFL